MLVNADDGASLPFLIVIRRVAYPKAFLFELRYLLSQRSRFAYVLLE